MLLTGLFPVQKIKTKGETHHASCNQDWQFLPRHDRRRRGGCGAAARPQRGGGYPHRTHCQERCCAGRTTCGCGGGVTERGGQRKAGEIRPFQFTRLTNALITKKVQTKLFLFYCSLSYIGIYILNTIHIFQGVH